MFKVGTDKPDAVLLDATMPGMDGVEVCRQIRQNPGTANVAVIALTGRMDEEIAAAFKQASRRVPAQNRWT